MADFTADFMGIANMNAIPNTGENNVFYIASQRGIYSNFRNLYIRKNLALLAWDAKKMLWSAPQLGGSDELNYTSFFGMITPDFRPELPVRSAFYLASFRGDYKAFNISVTKSVAIIYWLKGSDKWQLWEPFPDEEQGLGNITNIYNYYGNATNVNIKTGAMPLVAGNHKYLFSDCGNTNFDTNVIYNLFVSIYDETGSRLWGMLPFDQDYDGFSLTGILEDGVNAVVKYVAVSEPTPMVNIRTGHFKVLPGFNKYLFATYGNPDFAPSEIYNLFTTFRDSTNAEVHGIASGVQDPDGFYLIADLEEGVDLYCKYMALNIPTNVFNVKSGVFTLQQGEVKYLFADTTNSDFNENDKYSLYLTFWDSDGAEVHGVVPGTQYPDGFYLTSNLEEGKTAYCKFLAALIPNPVI